MNEATSPEKNSAYPWRFRPVYKDYLWGGDRIIRHYHRQAPPGIYAESWEVSTRPEGPGIVANGPLAGTPLADLLPGFPLLIKLIDARETLSIQVHPDNQTARAHGGDPKTEMWYVLAADPGACVYCGLKPGVDEKALRAALTAKTVGDLLIKHPVRPGDAIYVPGGRVHAIGAGCLLLECQQNSNTTHRLYDWDRIGPDGRPRPLHIEESIRVINWNDRDPVCATPTPLPCPPPNRRDLVLHTEHFHTERLHLTAPLHLRPEKPGFQILFIADGTLRIATPGHTEHATPGTTWLLPPAVTHAELIPAPTATVIHITAGETSNA